MCDRCKKDEHDCYAESSEGDFDELITPNYTCIICGKPLPDDYEPAKCCDGRDCGCMGLPPHPVCCSDVCEDAVYRYVGKAWEERRILAGISRYES